MSKYERVSGTCCACECHDMRHCVYWIHTVFILLADDDCPYPVLWNVRCCLALEVRQRVFCATVDTSCFVVFLCNSNTRPPAVGRLPIGVSLLQEFRISVGDRRDPSVGEEAVPKEYALQVFGYDRVRDLVVCLRNFGSSLLHNQNE